MYRQSFQTQKNSWKFSTEHRAVRNANSLVSEKVMRIVCQSLFSSNSYWRRDRLVDMSRIHHAIYLQFLFITIKIYFVLFPCPILSPGNLEKQNGLKKTRPMVCSLVSSLICFQAGWPAVSSLRPAFPLLHSSAIQVIFHQPPISSVSLNAKPSFPHLFRVP